jgi:O-6-methylguanine DNA methyltransferase
MIGLYTKNSGGMWFGVACDEQRVFATSFAVNAQRALQDLLSSIPFNAPFQVFSESSGFAEKVLTTVKDIYDGKGAAQGVALAMEHLPAYTQRVLRTVAMVPVGYVTSYGRVAEAAGGGARAVGNVMAANPFAPIVPCHRVVGANFGLGGYGGGLDMKHAFLVREKRGYNAEREVPIEGKKLRVFPVERVLKKLKKKHV